MYRWSLLWIVNAWPTTIFYGFISIMSITVAAYALPIGSITVGNETKSERALGGGGGLEIPQPEILRFMRRFGYLAGNAGDGNEDALALYHESAIVEAIKNVQKYGALEQTGQLDNHTLNLLNSPRCGVPDIEGTPYYLMTTTAAGRPNVVLPDATASARKRTRHKRYVIGARPWEKRRIRYFFANWSYRLPRAQIERDFARAAQLWSKHSNLHFIRVNNTTADIIVGFGTGYHGDGFSFDGPGGILAHAYYPYDQGSFGGDIHFDEDENWSNIYRNLANGIDFYAVAAHEIGHSLGLAHSPVTTSIMFPYYKGIAQELDRDDIQAMREIYLHRSLPDDGPIYREVFYVPSTKTTETIFKKLNAKEPLNLTFQGDYETIAQHKQRYGQALTTNNVDDLHSSDSLNNTSIPDVCSGSFDAVTAIKGFVHIFKESYIWKLTMDYSLFDGFPKSIFEMFPFFRDEQMKRIDAAYERYDGALMLFSGSKYWLFNTSTNLRNSSGSISELLGNQNNNAITKISAAMVWPKNNLTYIFANTKFWRFDDRLKKNYVGYPKSMRRWPGIPNNIDAAATLTNGKTYFFKRNLYWLYNNEILRPEHGYPRPIGPAWFKNLCTSDQKQKII